MERSYIEELLRKAAIEPTSLKTVLDETQALYEQKAIVPTAERIKRPRKQDIRTKRRLRRERMKRQRELGIIKPEDGQLRRDFHKLRLEVLRRGRKDARADSKANWEWKISLDEWLWMWFSCPMVEIGFNVRKPAWKARGRNVSKDVQLKRIDINKPWEINNLKIVRGKQELYNGGIT